MAQRDSSPVYYREVQKNAYLKRIPDDVSGGKLRPLALKKAPLKPMWTQLCVHNGRTPYLEQYRDPASARAHRPAWRASLVTARHVTASVTPRDTECDFLIHTHHGPVRMLAPTWECMQDWVSTLRNKLHELRIVPLCENVYMSPPVAPPPRAAARDPTSPLPPTPPLPPDRVPGIDLTSVTRAPPIPETPPEPITPESPPETPHEIDISTWDDLSLPSTSQAPTSVAKICGQNICLDDSIFRRGGVGGEESGGEFDSDGGSEGSYRQTVVVGRTKEAEDITRDRPSNITVIQVCNKEAPHTAIPVIGLETDIFDFQFKTTPTTQNPDFINIVNTETVHDYGTVFTDNESNYGHLSLTTTVSLTGDVRAKDNEDLYERLCMASTKPSPLPVRRLKSIDKLRKSSLPNLDSDNSTYEYLFLSENNNSSSNNSNTTYDNITTISNNSTPISNNSTPISNNSTQISTHSTQISNNSTQISNNSTPISNNGTPISTHSTQISNNSTPISNNSTPISNNGTPISTHSTQISNISTQISNNSTPISNNSSPISNNSTLISANSTQISNISTQISNNSTPISNNSSPISNNSTLISANSTPISANSTLISTNSTQIFTHSTPISANSTPISTHSTPISTHSTPISTHSTPISANSTPISVSSTTISSTSNVTEINCNRHVNSVSVSNVDSNARSVQSNIVRTPSQNAYDAPTRPERRLQNEGPKTNGKVEKSEPQHKPIWKRGLTELSLLSRLRGLGHGRTADSPGRNTDCHDRSDVTSPAKVLHRSRPDARVDRSRRRSSSLTNGQSPPPRAPAALQPLRARQAAALEAAQRRGAAVVGCASAADPPLFADYNKQVWVAWWGAGGPRCAGRGGDRVCGLRACAPRDAAHARQLVHSSYAHGIDILFHRVPLGKIYVVSKRDQETIGIKLDNECNITSVDAESPAARAGIPPLGKWAVTEVNNRPLNLLKGGEEEMNRLSLHGTEASVLIQPSALVKKLRGALKGNKTLLGLR